MPSQIIPHELATLTVDLAAVRSNYRILKQHAYPASVAGVVKADAYGLGMAKIARTLAAEGCKEFFVATVGEGIELRTHLREASIAPNEATNASEETTVYVLCGNVQNSEEYFLHHNLVPVLNDEWQIERWRDYGAKKPAALHIDTAMNRLGIGALRLAGSDGLNKIMRHDGLNISLIMSHMSCADTPQTTINELQISQFERFRNDLQQIGNYRFSLANSALLLSTRWTRHNLTKTRSDLARPGIALYGVNPFASESKPKDLKQVAYLHARIIMVRELAVGETVGYAATWKAQRSSTIATVGAGYGSGIPRLLTLGDGTSKQLAYIDKMPVPYVGRVSMDTLALDVTDLPTQPLPGKTVEIIGNNATVENMANNVGTCGYEILTGLSTRLRREYIN